jgi:hypothetical protein
VHGNEKKDLKKDGTVLTAKGNCAVWSTMGLKKSGVIDWVSMFPKLVLIRMGFHCAMETKVKSQNATFYGVLSRRIFCIVINICYSGLFCWIFMC